MKEVLLEEKSILGMKSKVIIATLVLTVIVGLGTAVQAVSDGAPNETAWLLYKQTAHFNPFTLSTGTLSTPMGPRLGDSGAITLDEPMRIPPRPPHRTPGKPSWVPGPPPWHPHKWL